MGATVHEQGCTFRVWAPFADEVSVAGDFTTPTWANGMVALARDADPDYWSAFVLDVKPGANYKFVLRNSSIPDPIWKLDPYCRDATGSGTNDDSVVRDPHAFDWQGDAFRIDNWNELVIYEMHVGTFYDNPGDPVGDFSQVIRKLDHLVELGVNAIEVMPAGEFMAEVSMGYNPSLLFAVEEAYGREQVFQELVRECHKRGIAVLLDVVYNHFGPTDLDGCLWRFDGWSENGKGGVYFYNDWKSVTPWGDKNRPDYGRRAVFRFLRDNAFMWLDDYHCDGLRWDSTVNIRNVNGKNNDPANDIGAGWELMRLVNDEMAQKYPHRLSIAEDLQGNEWITRRASDWGAGFGAQWDSGFAHDIYRAILPMGDEDRDMAAVKAAVERKYNGDAFRRVIYTESHDEVKQCTDKDGNLVRMGRVPEKIWWGNAASWESRKRSTLGAAIALTSPGIPMLFMGQEFLEWDSWWDRDPLEWSQKDRFRGIFGLYCDLVRLRRNWHNNTRGLRGQHVNVFHVNWEAKVIAYHRWADGGPGDDVVVVANFGKRTYDGYNVGFPRDGTWYLRFNSDWRGYSDDFSNVGYDTSASRGSNQGMPCNGNAGLGAYSAIVMSQ
jgi:1,4-alpha-glucan branching enzyme